MKGDLRALKPLKPLKPSEYPLHSLLESLISLNIFLYSNLLSYNGIIRLINIYFYSMLYNPLYVYSL